MYPEQPYNTYTKQLELAKQLAREYPVRKIAAIKEFRKATGFGLVQAKNIVDIAFDIVYPTEGKPEAVFTPEQIMLNVIKNHLARNQDTVLELYASVTGSTFEQADTVFAKVVLNL